MLAQSLICKHSTETFLLRLKRVKKMNFIKALFSKHILRRLIITIKNVFSLWNHCIVHGSTCTYIWLNMFCNPNKKNMWLFFKNFFWNIFYFSVGSLTTCVKGCERSWRKKTKKIVLISLKKLKLLNSQQWMFQPWKPSWPNMAKNIW